jgi:5-methylcytosine-specific restriction endonuclease McrA
MTKHKLFTNTCPTCFIEFETEWQTKVYCRRYCKERAREMRRPDYKPRQLPVVEKRICIGCEATFEIKQTSLRKYCSAQCREWQRQQKRRDRQEITWQAKNSPLLKARIYYRDKGVCQLCQKTIDLTLQWPNPMMFSIDHIIPRSQGGNHTMPNLQSAHLICNSRRRDNPMNV